MPDMSAVSLASLTSPNPGIRSRPTAGARLVHAALPLHACVRRPDPEAPTFELDAEESGLPVAGQLVLGNATNPVPSIFLLPLERPRDGESGDPCTAPKVKVLQHRGSAFLPPVRTTFACFLGIAAAMSDSAWCHGGLRPEVSCCGRKAKPQQAARKA